MSRLLNKIIISVSTCLELFSVQNYMYQQKGCFRLHITLHLLLIHSALHSCNVDISSSVSPYLFCKYQYSVGNRCQRTMFTYMTPTKTKAGLGGSLPHTLACRRGVGRVRVKTTPSHWVVARCLLCRSVPAAWTTLCVPFHMK